MERRSATAAETKALAHPLRLRILRLCLDEALTNKQLADRLGVDPATLLHHVRTLVRTEFIVAEASRTGARGAREKPYRSTGKSWTLEVGPDEALSGSMANLDAYRAEFIESGAPITSTRFAARLSSDDLDELARRLLELADEFVGRDDADGIPVGFLFAGHRRSAPAADDES